MKRAYINGILLDGTQQMEPQAHKVLLCEDGVITAIADEGTDLDGYEVIDLHGGYAMPGLINLHVHLAGNGKPSAKPRDNAALVRKILSNGLTRAVAYRMVCSYAKLELLGGVTTIRTVGGIADFDTRCRDDAQAGKILAPRILAAQDDTAADAGAQRDDDGILVALGTACDVLAVGGSVGVVLDIDLAAKQGLEVRAEVPVVIAEVRVEADEAGGKVHAAGRADADIFDVGKIDLIILGHGAAQVGQCLFQILRRARQPGGPGQLADDLIIFVDNTGGHCGAAQVDTNRVLAHTSIPPTSSAQALPCNFNSAVRFAVVAFMISSSGKFISSSMP